VDFIRRHAGEGRLTTEELSDRVGAALTAKTLGDLDDLVVDLPPQVVEAPAPPPPPSRPGPSFLAGAGMRYAVAVLLLLSLAGGGDGRGHGILLGFWVVALLVLRFVRRADRRRRWQARAQARDAQFPPPPLDATSWHPPRADHWR
jgi:hypothetical protein